MITYSLWTDRFCIAVANFLGDLTDELKCYGRGCYISKFVSGVPKDHAFTVFGENGKTVKSVCKWFRILTYSIIVE